jgi:small-conductance mechanosensitive channel
MVLVAGDGLVGQTATPNGTVAETPGWVPAEVARLLSIVPPWAVDTVLAIVVLLIGYLVSRLLVRVLSRRIARRFRRPSITQMILRGIRAVVFLFALLTILGIYGFELADIALSVTVFTAVIGVILAPIVGSIISGMFLLADQPYEIGDMVELADTGQYGFVEDITLRYTKIFTLDNTFLVVPNGTIRGRDVVNYSAEDSRTRESLDLLVTYESDIERTRELVRDAARRVDGVIEGGPEIRLGAARYPAAPRCYIAEYADHGVLLRLRYWLKEPYWLLRRRSEIQSKIWTAIQDEDVEIAYPHQHQVFDETSGSMAVELVDEADSVGRGPTDHPTDPRPDDPGAGPSE